MKKTEKIEVRLSHEEKTALTTLAEQEDRSVSDLVRGLIERYMSINTQSLPRKTPWVKFGAIAVAGFFAGHLMTYFIAKSHEHVPVYSLNVRMDVDASITVPILKQAGQSDEFLMPQSGGDVIVKTKVVESLNNLAKLEIELCQKIDSNCEKIAAPTLNFDSERIAGLRFKDSNDETILISLTPPERDED